MLKKIIKNYIQKKVRNKKKVSLLNKYQQTSQNLQEKKKKIKYLKKANREEIEKENKMLK